jgi:hypothetical protein
MVLEYMIWYLLAYVSLVILEKTFDIDNAFPYLSRDVPHESRMISWVFMMM